MTDAHQAHVDAEILRTLRLELTHFAGRIEQLDADLHGALAHLGRTFQDAEYERFRSHYASSSQKLRGFVEAIRSLTPRLDRDIEDLVAAERIRPPGG